MVVWGIGVWSFGKLGLFPTHSIVNGIIPVALLLSYFIMHFCFHSRDVTMQRLYFFIYKINFLGESLCSAVFRVEHEAFAFEQSPCFAGKAFSKRFNIFRLH